MKPFLAESGEGCDDVRTRFSLSSMRLLKLLALFPHRRYTILFLVLLMLLTISFVNISQPLFM